MAEQKKIKKTILILGVSSFVGSNLAEYLKRDYRIIGTFYENPVKIPDVLTVYCDVLNRDAVQMIIYTFRPDMAIYCVGLTSIDDCAQQEKFADTINTVGAYNVAAFTERYKAQICYISTSYVFSGIDRYFNENDTPDPFTMYGKTKAAAEFFIQKSCLNYLIFRVCNLYGRSLNPRQMNFFEFIQYKMLREETVHCDGNIYVGFLDVYYLGFLIKMAIELETSNRLFQICSPDYMTYHDFAKTYSEVFDLNNRLIAKTSWPFEELRREGNFIEGEKRYFKMSNSNIENYFNIKMPTIKESLEFTFKRFKGKIKHSTKKSKTGMIEYI